jgi:hypothetical protein
VAMEAGERLYDWYPFVRLQVGVSWSVIAIGGSFAGVTGSIQHY